MIKILLDLSQSNIFDVKTHVTFIAISESVVDEKSDTTTISKMI